MQIKINKQDFEIPFDPMLITLGQYISYSKEYGQELDDELDEILKKEDWEDEDEKEVALDNYIDKEAVSWIAFWTKLDFFDLMESPGIINVINQYKLFKRIFIDAQKEAQDSIDKEINWNDDVWEIKDYKLNPATEMCFNEIITSKEVIRQVKKFSLGKWMAMKYLCAVFLRKKDEKFVDQLVWEKGERLKLMDELPLAYALRVGFFLKICVNIWKTTSQYFLETEIPAT